MLIVVTDTSASMEEMGKLQLAVSAMSYIRERFRFKMKPFYEFELKFILWGEEAYEIDLKKEKYLTELDAMGKVEVATILKVLDDLMEAKDVLHTLLLITDGAFIENDVSIFSKWVREKPELIVRTIAIGPDALVNNLKKISGHEPFRVEEMAMLADSISSWSLGNIKKPSSLSEVNVGRDPNLAN